MTELSQSECLVRCSEIKKSALSLDYRARDLLLTSVPEMIKDSVGPLKTSHFMEQYSNKACDRNRKVVMRNLLHLVKEKGEERSFVKLLLAYLLSMFYSYNKQGLVPSWPIHKLWRPG